MNFDKISPMPLTWRDTDQRIKDRLACTLQSWRRTPYRDGQAMKGVGVNCATFIAEILAELEYRSCPDIRIPNPKIAFHNKASALGALRRFRRCFPGFKKVEGRDVEPGDILVIGKVDKGPGHCLIVGHQKNTVWECHQYGVAQSGWILWNGWRIYSIYRKENRSERWLNSSSA